MANEQNTLRQANIQNNRLQVILRTKPTNDLNQRLRKVYELALLRQRELGRIPK